MFVCDCCLQAIESHERHQFSRKVDFFNIDNCKGIKWANEDEEIAICDWCEEEFEVTELNEI